MNIELALTVWTTSWLITTIFKATSARCITLNDLVSYMLAWIIAPFELLHLLHGRYGKTVLFKRKLRERKTYWIQVDKDMNIVHWSHEQMGPYIPPSPWIDGKLIEVKETDWAYRSLYFE